MREGYIKIYRKMFENPDVMKDSDHIATWVYLLAEAEWKPTEDYFKGKKITLKPGQLTIGRKQIASALRVTESKIQRILKCFESEHLIEQQTSNRNRLITIVKWNEYQQNEQQNEQRMNNKRTTDEQQMNTPEEVKNIRNNKSIYKGVPEEIKEPFMEWVSMRAKIKKPVTSKITVTRALNRLDELADTTEEKIELIELAIERCWSSFYRPKEDKNEAARHTKPDERRESDDPGYYEWAASGFARSS